MLDAAGALHDLRHRGRVPVLHPLHTTRPFGNALAVVPVLERAGYIGLTAFMVNVIVTVVLTFVFRALRVGNGTDVTKESDYFADIGDPGGPGAGFGGESRSTDLLAHWDAANETSGGVSMAKGGRKRRARRKKNANHGKRPNS